MSRRDSITPNSPGGRASVSAAAGARDHTGRILPFAADPVRVPSVAYVPNGYLRGGYDTGRIW